MLICYVCVPDTFNKDNLKSPKCIEQFVIKVIIIMFEKLYNNYDIFLVL